MGHTFHRDDQDRKSQTSDYTAPRKKQSKITPLQAAQEAELQSKTLGEIQKRYLDSEEEIDLTDERSNFLDDK